MTLLRWTGAARPERVVLEGRYARLEPLHPDIHGADLLASARQPGAVERFRYLFDEPPADEAAMAAWLAGAAATEDPLFFAVVDRATGRAEGRQALMRIDPTNGVVEIGNILWGPAMARTRVATEALFLTANYVFADRGYRRLEWKCDNNNEPSKRAAMRFGFTHEGVFRQHMVVKDMNRDTAWFSLTDRDWSEVRGAYEIWLTPSNFDPEQKQRRTLKEICREWRRSAGISC